MSIDNELLYLGCFEYGVKTKSLGIFYSRINDPKDADFIVNNLILSNSVEGCLVPHSQTMELPIVILDERKNILVPTSINKEPVYVVDTKAYLDGFLIYRTGMKKIYGIEMEYVRKSKRKTQTTSKNEERTQKYTTN